MFDVAHVYNLQSQNAAAASKDWQTYESFKTKPKEPNPAEISMSIPDSEATKHSDGMMNQLRTPQYTNSQNLARDNALHEQVKAQLRKDGMTNKAVMISQNYSTRSEKGQALLGS